MGAHVKGDPLDLLGVPYVLGASDPAIGFDCWTLVRYVRATYFDLDTPLAISLRDAPDIQPSERIQSAGNHVSVRHAQRLIEAAQRTGQWRRVDGPPSPGMVVGMSLSHRTALHHVGVAIPAGVLHAWCGPSVRGIGSVIVTPWNHLRPIFADVEVYECRA